MHRRSLGLSALTISGIALMLVIARYAAPAPQPPRSGSFSADNARSILHLLVGEGVPHPMGSPTNARVRDSILALLRGLGYEPELQRAFVCGANGACGTVENILARLAGTGGAAAARDAVLVAVHYDSVGAGPGASDDGMAVAAVLEVARMLRRQPLRNDVIFLIDDGEEQGLLGARAFAEQHPWAADVGSVINVEARGTSGASILFETSPGNRPLVSVAGPALPRPVMNSITYTIYKLLPNDTDFTVFKEHGWAGVNFAIIGSPALYHTSRDDFAHAHPGSLQHHGENILAMTRELGSRERRALTGEDAVFFDVLSFLVVHWPERWTPIIAVAVAGIFLAGLMIGGGGRKPDILLGVASVIALLVLSGGGAYLLHQLLARFGAFPADWTAPSGAWLIAFWTLPVAAALLVGWLVRNRDATGIWIGIWAVWIIAAGAAAFLLPAVSYPLIVPAAAAALSSLAVRSNRWRPVAILLPLATAAVLIFPIAWLLYDAMGAPMLPAIALLTGLALVPSVVAFGGFDRSAALAPAIIVVAAVIAGVALPPFSERVPAHAAMTVYQEEIEPRRLLAEVDGPLPDALRKAGFGTARVRPYTFDPRVAVFAAPIEIAPAEPPELQITDRVVQGDAIAFRARLISHRTAPVAGVFLPRARIASVSVNGRNVPLRKGRSAYAFVRVVTMPPDDVVLEWTLLGTEPAAIQVADVSYGLPPEATAAARARPAQYVTYGSGDRVIVSREMLLD
jgi:hypothetical protein